MRLLYVLPEYMPHAGGGIVTFYRMLLPRLAAMGHEVRVVVGSGVVAERAAPPLRVDGVRVEVLDVDLHRKHLAGFERYAAMPGLRSHLAAAWAMWEQAGRGAGFDVVECADWGLPFLPWVLEVGPPVLVQMHGSCGQIELHDPVAGEESQGEMIRLLEMLGLGLPDCVQTYSESNETFWRAQARRPVACLRPGWQPLIDAPPAAARSGRGLVVGRVQRWKGPQVLCEALRLVGDRALVIDWVGRDTAYGDRDTKTSVHLARTYPDVWGSRLVHHPQRPPEEVARLQSGADFVVVPSTWDMFNFTCVEAMGAGTPVICSTGAGASELIEDGVNGFVYQAEDAAALAGCLSRFLQLGAEKRRALGEAGRRTVLRELDPDRAAERRVAAYEAMRMAPRVPQVPGDWLRHACAPRTVGGKGLSFLDHMPLDPLARYVWRRGLSRIWK